MDKIKRFIAVVTINGFVSTLLGFILMSSLNSAIGIDVWEYKVSYLAFYAFLVSSIFYANYYLPLFSFKQLSALTTLAILSYLFSITIPIGLMAICTIIIAIYLASFMTQKLNSNIGRYLIVSTLITAIVGSIWVVDTAPIYSEGFVVLMWMILAILNAIISIGFYLVNRYFNIELHSKKYNHTFLISLGLLTLGASLSISSLYYMIWIEGEPTAALVRDSSWNVNSKSIDSVPAELAETLSSPQVTQQMFVDYLQKNEELSISKIATLYFLTKDISWANKFKTSLLQEASKNKFTGKTDSMKFAQREAMTRAMFLLEIQKKLPNYLTPQEEQIITKWFENITRRIFNPEWVDSLYAVPFKDDPDGPYLNQEVGAGTLTVVRHFIKDEALLKKITVFLAEKSAGFVKNYRNPDDSLGYQNIWIENAFVMHLYGDANSESLAGMKLAVEWLISQLPQTVTLLEYGLPGDLRPINTLAISAFYLKDKKSRWLLDQHLKEVMNSERNFPPEIFAFWLWDDEVLAEKAYFESVVLDGPTGYAFRPGPIEPDKVVLRNVDMTTTDESTFLLANLRNIGWHRYPATNTTIRIILDDYSVVGEDIIKKDHKWLPEGRAKHRDKKIDRLRLNGLQIARDGLDSWIGGITGVYSKWRQDVPRTSQVMNTQNIDGFKSVTIVLNNWASTIHTRNYILTGSRQVFVVDEISTSKASLPKQLTWHIQPDMLQVSPSLFENEKYAIALSDNTKDATEVVYKSVDEVSAYSQFSSDKFIGIDVTGFETYTAITAFSSKHNLVSEINAISTPSSIYQKVFSYKLSDEEKYLVLTKKNHWLLVDSLDD
jgi:hypothetical protein